MPFFTNFPKVSYKFGEEDFDVQFPDLVRYSEILDTIRSNGSFYQKYYIRNGWRPDNVSYELYRSTNLHWTFFYLNDTLREQGWPLDQYQIEQKIADDFPNTVIVTRDEIYDTFNVGSVVTDVTSGVTGTIIKKNIDLGQLFIEGSKEFTTGNSISVTEDDETYFITVTSFGPEQDAAMYYVEEGGEKVDIDPFTGPTSGQSAVSYSDYYLTQNQGLRDIIVMKPQVAQQFRREFKDAMRST
jgi:hypothetical protein